MLLLFLDEYHMIIVNLKGEQKSDNLMISVSGEDQEDLTVKVWANLDNQFLSYGFLKF